MEKRTQYQTTTPSPRYDQFHLRLPADLLEWYRQRATEERRKINAVMTAALESYRVEIAKTPDIGQVRR